MFVPNFGQDPMAARSPMPGMLQSRINGLLTKLKAACEGSRLLWLNHDLVGLLGVVSSDGAGPRFEGACWSLSRRRRWGTNAA